ncbi:MAG: hypothetical protein QF570_12225 [Myxococcota bacterium]|jgi:hypothetical protein|nr:hypothetical protein [Myxococcota bacterium]
MLTAMFAVLLGWLCLALAFAGLGSLLERAVAPGAPPALARSFWLGFAVWLGALEVLHFFVALQGWGVSLPLFALGAVGVALHARIWWTALRTGASANPLAWVGFAVFVAWLCNRALGPLLTVDAGLYHLQSIQWATQHPLVGGLANLHGRLAFNSSAFLWMGSLDALFAPVRGFHLASGLLIGCAVAERIARICGPGDARRKRFEASMLLPLGYAATVMHVSSTSPDWTVLVLGLTAGSLGLDLLSTPARDDAWRSFVCLAAVAAAGVTIKLSFAALAVAIAIVHTARALRANSKLRLGSRAWVITAALVLWLAVPWTVRGIELSGYPAYPLTWFAPDVAWQTPPSRVRAEVDWIRGWARAPGRDPAEVNRGWDWLVPWARARLKQSDSVALLVFPLATLFVAIPGVRRPRRPDPRGLATLPFAVAVVAWFISAPDPRFLGAALWVPVGWLASAASEQAKPARLQQAVRWVVAAGFAIYCAAMAASLDAWIIGPSPSLEVRSATTKAVRTRNGLELNVPVKGDRCWEAPLPCTPYPAPRLGLRNPDEPWSGYILVETNGG